MQGIETPPATGTAAVPPAGTAGERARIAELEAELEALREDHERFIYVASHDLRAPLRALSILPVWIRETLTGKYGCVIPDIEIDLREMETQSRRLDALLVGLLEFSRIGRMYAEPEDFDPRVAILGTFEEAGVSELFPVSLATGLPAVRCNRTAFTIAMRNLIANAIKHHDLAEGRVEVRGWQRGEIAYFEVTDDGPGIEEAFHDRIFELFTTLRPRDEVEGSGTGLAVVHKFAGACGGAISLRPNATGRGTTFRLSLPAGTIATEVAS